MVARLRRREPDDRQIGAILLSAGAITDPELARALLVQKERGGRLGEILASLGCVSEEDVLRARGLQLGVDSIRLSGFSLDLGLLAGLPLEFLGKRRLLPLRLCGNGVEVAAADPMREEDLQFLGHYYRRPVDARLASAKEILVALTLLARRYGDRVPDRRGEERLPPRPPRQYFFETGSRSGSWRRGRGSRWLLAALLLVLWAVVSNRLIFAWVERQRDGEARETRGAPAESGEIDKARGR
ncbi:MAG: hypothetical protein HY720_09515 [Planctomycetes bacterium]|nr:hypothetical protein [Planctomycetota bacterium]